MTRPARVAARQAAGELLYRVRLRRPQPGTLTVLMYHAITATPVDDDYQMSVPASLFAEHMASLRDWGVDVLPLGEALVRVETRDLDKPAAAVTFDDGYVGVHEYGAEALRRYDVPSTLFVTTGAIGRSRFDGVPESLGRPLTWNEVVALTRETRCIVGSHSVTHPVLARTTETETRSELSRSRETIADRAGVLPSLFAYPYGSYGSFSARTRRALIDEGFAAACTTVWGRHRAGDDPFAIRRVRVSWCDSGRELTKMLAGCYDWFRIVQRWQRR